MNHFTTLDFTPPTEGIRFYLQDQTLAHFHRDGLILNYGPFENDDQLASYMVGLLLIGWRPDTGPISMTLGGDQPTTLTFTSEFLTNPAHASWLERLTPTQVHFMERFVAIIVKLSNNTNEV
jgi:hypothetical protein